MGFYNFPVDEDQFDMFLIVAKWKDNSHMIFLARNDPSNKKLPNWNEIFSKLDTISDPSSATILFARVSREFALRRDEETLQFTLHDPITCSELKPLKLSTDAHLHWYRSLLESSECSEDTLTDFDESFEDLDDDFV